MRRPALTALRRAADPLLVGRFALLLAFPVLASVAAHRQARPPADAAPVATPVGPGAGLTLRDLPAFSTEPDLTRSLASAAAMKAAVHDALVETFGPRRGAALARIARTYRPGIDAVDAIDVAQVPYPFRYPPIAR